MNRYDSNIHQRRSIRIKNHDYAQNGVYFVTICTQNRICLFGEIKDETIHLCRYGDIVSQTWEWLRERYQYVYIGDLVIMPNHLHGIIIINHDSIGNTTCRGGSRTAHDGNTHYNAPNDGNASINAYENAANDYAVRDKGGSRTAPTKTLGRIIGAFKTVSTKKINQMRNTPGIPIWQRNYYEHIISSDDEYARISKYITNNPKTWEKDRLWIK